MGGIGAFAVRQWQFTLVVFAMLAAMGVSALLTIPRAEDPNFPTPIISIVAVMPGADPLDMEKLVTDPIEDAVAGLDDIDKIESKSRDGVANIVVHFTWGVDTERKYDQVVREVNAIRGTLPDGLVRLDLKKIETSMTNFVQIALVSDTAPMRELEERGRVLKDMLDRVDGVRETELWGEPRTEVRVAVDLGRLASLGIPVSAVADALQAEGMSIPIGAVHAGARRFNVKATGDFKTLEDVGDTVITAHDGTVVKVSDVATVSWSADEPTHIARYNGHPAVFVTANQKDGQNIFKMREAIYALLDDFERDLPANIKLERGFDQSVSVAHRLSNLFRDFAIALGLVLITLLPLGFRASIVVMLSIPLSLAIGVSALQFSDFSLNQLSIA
ncbi:MAG: efflux RND transporter permease subunit, partial [Zavarzinia sp.]|nr:efflux RND transporter permease subunit [Zavarzinia sp.]